MATRRFVPALWLLSGVPIGLALIVMPPVLRAWSFALFVLLETGHALSPIVLACSHTGFRALMLRRPGKYVLLPGVVFLAALAVGMATSWGWTSYNFAIPHQRDRITDLTNPFPLMVWLYWAWNIYHFGMQHFGVARLVGVGTGSRRLDMALCLGVTAFLMVGMPLLIRDFWVVMLMTGVISVNHWVVDIGLSSRASCRHWLFAAGVLTIGIVGFIWMIPTANGMMIDVIPVVLGARYGLGFVHFLYSRWVWCSASPIRADLFRWAGPNRHCSI
jgi:hypothetical protein